MSIDFEMISKKLCELTPRGGEFAFQNSEPHPSGLVFVIFAGLEVEIFVKMQKTGEIDCAMRVKLRSRYLEEDVGYYVTTNGILNIAAEEPPFDDALERKFKTTEELVNHLNPMLRMVTLTPKLRAQSLRQKVAKALKDRDYTHGRWVGNSDGWRAHGFRKQGVCISIEKTKTGYACTINGARHVLAMNNDGEKIVQEVDRLLLAYVDDIKKNRVPVPPLIILSEDTHLGIMIDRFQEDWFMGGTWDVKKEEVCWKFYAHGIMKAGISADVEVVYGDEFDLYRAGGEIINNWFFKLVVNGIVYDRTVRIRKPEGDDEHCDGVILRDWDFNTSFLKCLDDVIHIADTVVNERRENIFNPPGLQAAGRVASMLQRLDELLEP